MTIDEFLISGTSITPEEKEHDKWDDKYRWQWVDYTKRGVKNDKEY